ncbi:MAG: hypothetical protein V4556_12535 [Bacteroidota bacterium]
MKYIIKLLFLLTINITLFAADDVKFTVNYSCVGTISGYDHITKMIIYSDGKLMGESIPKKQSIANSLTVNVSAGAHKIKAVLYALNDHKWEERTVANDYAFDCFLSRTIAFLGNKTIDLVFDFNQNKLIEKGASQSYLDGFDFLDKTITTSSDTQEKNTTEVSANKPGEYKTELKKLNDYLKTFDNGYYGYIEVKDGYIYNQFKSGKYNKYKMEDMEGAVIQEEYQRVIFKCKGTNKCIYSTWNDDYHEYSQFLQNYKEYNYKELADLLNNFRDAYLGVHENPAVDTEKKITTDTKAPKTKSLSGALKKLNDYLRAFDDRYTGIDIVAGYIHSEYQNDEYSKAKIEDLDKATINTEYNYVKLSCKSGSCVYSTITESYHDYFNFQSSKGKDMTVLAELLNDFIDLAKERKANLRN